MGMMESLTQLREEAESKLKDVQSSEELEQLLVDVLGRNGSLTSILRTMGKLASEERASVGAFSNKVLITSYSIHYTKLYESYSRRNESFVQSFVSSS